MALVFNDRVRESATAPGLGSITLLGAPTGFQTFADGIGNANTCYYCIQAVDNAGALTGGWEVGIGTVTGSSLSRDTVYQSSNADAKVNFTGLVQVFNTIASQYLGTLTPVTPASPTTSVQYNNAGAFGGSANLIFDGSLETLTANALAATQDSTKGFLLTNTSLSTSPARVQVSPATQYHGNAWNNALPGNVTQDWRTYIRPVDGGTSNYVWDKSLGGGVYSDAATLTSGGVFTASKAVLQNLTLTAFPTGFLTSTAGIVGVDTGTYVKGSISNTQVGVGNNSNQLSSSGSLTLSPDGSGTTDTVLNVNNNIAGGHIAGISLNATGGSKGTPDGIATYELNTANYNASFVLDESNPHLAINGTGGSFLNLDEAGGYSLYDLNLSGISSDGTVITLANAMGGASITIDDGGGLSLFGINTNQYISFNDAANEIIYGGGSNTTHKFNNGNLTISTTGIISKYLNIATGGNGTAIIRGTPVNSTGNTAAKTATTLYAVPATNGAGQYRVSFNAKITTPATVSSVLGGTNGFQVIYTDQNDSVVVTTGALVDMNPLALNSNTTQTMYAGSIMVNCKASTNLQYQFDYTSVGATAMQYNLHITIEQL